LVNIQAARGGNVSPVRTVSVLDGIVTARV